ncbi:hypothetical protein [Staphylococcus aureus]|uniref:hypothetical protein n=1 Tax=Staphylococcus aureus TaxID=1280 RepID=UPI003BA85EF9
MSPKDTTRFETKPDHQAQFDWKESINFKTKDNQRIPLYIGVPTTLLFSFYNHA